MEAIIKIIDNVNYALDTSVMPIAILAMLIYFFCKKLVQWTRENGIGKGLYLWVISLIPVLAWGWIFWFGTAKIVSSPANVRWVFLYISLCSLVYFLSKKYGEKRGLISIFGHLTVGLLGWRLCEWFGILFVSLPILGIYYHTMYRLADAIIPASQPEDKSERWQRFQVLFWYTWGFQYPMQVVSEEDASGRKVETRIEGNSFNSFSQPGIIWLKSHQAAALTMAINFSRVEGPRVIFTKPYERLLEIVDLRTQLRRSTIDAVTKDGVRFKAIVFASFSLDRDEWTVETYAQLFHKNHVLLHGRKLDANINGIFPFSRPRVHSALMMRGKTSAAPEKQTFVYWDDRVINQVEVAASHILSDRKFDELWHPIKDGPGISALDEIADKLKERVAPNLLAQGVRLFAARVVALDFSEYKETEGIYDKVIKQQIESWQVDWESQKSHILANANAESNRLQQEARAYVQSVLLTAIAEGLQQTRIRYPNLPRHVIAMRFVGALEQLVRHQSETQENSNEDDLANLAKFKGRISTEKRGHYL